LHNYTQAAQISGIFFDITSNLNFWLLVILTVYISILPYLIITRIKFLFSDSLVNDLNHRNYENHFDRKKYNKKLNEMNKFLRTFEKVKKISKLDENYEPDNLADKKIKDMVETYRNIKILKTNKKDKDNKKNYERKSAKMILNDNNIATNCIKDDIDLNHKTSTITRRINDNSNNLNNHDYLSNINNQYCKIEKIPEHQIPTRSPIRKSSYFLPKEEISTKKENFSKSSRK